MAGRRTRTSARLTEKDQNRNNASSNASESTVNPEKSNNGPINLTNSGMNSGIPNSETNSVIAVNSTPIPIVNQDHSNKEMNATPINANQRLWKDLVNGETSTRSTRWSDDPQLQNNLNDGGNQNKKAANSVNPSNSTKQAEIPENRPKETLDGSIWDKFDISKLSNAGFKLDYVPLRILLETKLES